MKDVIVHLTNIHNTTLASAKIALFLSDTLGLDIVYTKPSKIKKYKNILLVNGPPAFCNWREELAEMVKLCKSLVFIQNDYTIAPPSQVNKVMRERGWLDEKDHVRVPHRWTTIPDKVLCEPFDAYVNWNSLTYEPVKMNRGSEKRIPKVFYYGAYRKGREEYFKEYFNDKVLYDIAVSCSSIAAKKYLDLNDNIEILKPFSSINDFNNYAATIYMEDKYSHSHYCSLANRFYECLGAGLPMLFEKSTRGTLISSGLKGFDSWVISSHKDIAAILKNCDMTTIARYQRELWSRNYKTMLKNRVRKLYEGL